jgi:hypothetical protein
MLLKNRAVQVKFVKNNPDDVSTDPTESISTVQAYADIVTELAWELAGVATSVIVVKTACDLLRIGAKAISR